mmetsp:Transcript_66440/g.130291  ORF Transcript_66440/g.130291 Transcript_66440/m.130291 type:complete len:551 (-) Transcript_66440:273-1925(-)
MSAFPEEDNVFLERNLRDESVSDHYAAETSWTDRLEQPKSKAINKDIDLEEAVNKINYLWVLISCGYMVSWTSIGSLISYFKARQGADFYVKLYFAFYLPGLPMSLLQQRYDEDIDRRMGSARAFMLRVTVGMGVKIGMLFFMPFVPSLFSQSQIPTVMLLCLVVMGTMTWMIHGTACQLCSMFPPSSTAWLQTGFRTPEIYTVVMVSALGLGAKATEAHVFVFYFVTAAVVGVGTLSWFVVARSKPALHYFSLKDETYALRDSKSKAESAANEERSSLLGNQINNKSGGSVGGQGSARGQGSSGSGSSGSQGYSNRTAEKCQVAGGGQGIAELGVDETKEMVAQVIRPCRVAIFLNIWSSIFTAAFFAYVKPAGNRDTEVILYFVRLFSDLVGRPLARLPRPWFLKTKDNLVVVAWVRLLLMAVFFAYIAFDWFPKNDYFVVGLVCVFSVLSGYLAVLSYEYAAASLQTKAGQSMAGTLMNSTFQMAAFIAVLMGVIVSELGLFTDPLESDGSGDDDDLLTAEGDLYPDTSSVASVDDNSSSLFSGEIR